MPSLEEIKARHKRESKVLDGEKRALLKKTKQTAGKGNKAKDKLAEVESEYDAKLKKLEATHKEEIAAFSSSSGDAEETAAITDATRTHSTTESATTPTAKTELTPAEDERERKQAKARRKREKAKERERQLQEEIERETAEAGPSMGQVELESIQTQLTPLGLKIDEIPPDGNCLYRAIAASLGNDSTYQETRNLCADTLLEKEDEFAPFCEYTDTIPDFATYVDRVRNSSDWGGHLELRVLSLALHKHILVYSVQSKEPLRIEPSDHTAADDPDPIRLSYHLHYYALGEHYNRVVKESEVS